MENGQPATLTGVSETALMTLWMRSVEAARPDGLLDDPLAVELVNSIDYPYREHFGVPLQVFATRALAYDGAIRSYLSEQPTAAVVALAEGLQTTYWRLNRPQSPWITVDLPPVIALRKSLLPQEDQVVNVPCSALDRSWMDLVPTEAPPLITVEGLFMYLDKPTILELIRDCAERFPGGRLIFDGVPEWWRRKKTKTLRGKRGSATGQRYVVPDHRSSTSAKEAINLPSKVPGVASAQAVKVPSGRGIAGAVQRAFYEGWLVPSAWRGSLHELRFAT